MKVVTIGRNSSNEYVVQDSTVSRHHCQILQDDYGKYRIVDFGSKNGTYVNGNKIYGEVDLKQTDIVRIGNTTLQWQLHFNPINNPLPPPISPPPIHPPYHPPPSYKGDQKLTNGLGIVVLILGLITFGIVGYIFIESEFFEIAPKIGFDLTMKLFPWYLKQEMMGWIIGALVSSGLTSLLAEAVMNEKDGSARAGQYIASFAGGIALLFLFLAIFANQIFKL